LSLDEEQVAAIGEGTKRFPVTATINGYTWRTTVTRMRGEFLLGLNRAVRETAGVETGDTSTAAPQPQGRPPSQRPRPVSHEAVSVWQGVPIGERYAAPPWAAIAAAKPAQSVIIASPANSSAARDRAPASALPAPQASRMTIGT
jgi:hypothetical protein